jgi:hypothetical protein
MKLKPSSEKDTKHFIVFALIFFTFSALVCGALYFNHKYGWSKHVYPQDTSYVKKADTILQIDSAALVKSDEMIVDSLELAWGSDRVNINNALNNIAGVEGSVNWIFDYHDVKYKSNPDLFVTEGIARPIPNDSHKGFVIKLLVNREKRRFKVLKAISDGKVLKGPMVIMSLALEGGYSQGVSF